MSHDLLLVHCGVEGAVTCDLVLKFGEYFLEVYEPWAIVYWRYHKTNEIGEHRGVSSALQLIDTAFQVVFN